MKYYFSSKPLTTMVRRLYLLVLAVPGAYGQAPVAEYLSEDPELIYSTRQDWGELGFDIAAHQTGREGQPLRIAEQSYAKGLGHHANGEILVKLDGEYESFDAEVGVQPCQGGSVVFRVLVDGQSRFDSGVMRSSEVAKPVSVSLKGAQELRLEARDAGDGIGCDMANWVNARLTLTQAAGRARASEPAVDIGRFARVVTWDPSRSDGARANRIQEFRAEDLFLETELIAGPDGLLTLPVSSNGLACVGLQWLNRRALKELQLTFPDSARVPASPGVRVEGWFGESLWQGNWKPLAGELLRGPDRLTFQLPPKSTVLTRKVRWVFPAGEHASVRSLSAFTRSRWSTTNLYVQLDEPREPARGEMSIYNGEILAGGDSAWRLSRPLHLTIRYSRSSPSMSDPTVLHFRLPTGAVGVAVEDVLRNDCVYVADYGLFVARKPLPVSLAQYRRRIANQKTILDEVRAMPDQTFAGAMTRTHHDQQREGPVILSLACENPKFVIERQGLVRFQVATNINNAYHVVTLAEVRPRFGAAEAGAFTRAIESGWLPIPVLTTEADGVHYAQRCFVAPIDEAGGDPARWNRRSVCVLEFTVTNKQTGPSAANLMLSFQPSKDSNSYVTLPLDTSQPFAIGPSGLTGLVIAEDASPLEVQIAANRLELKGTLPPQGGATLIVLLTASPGNLPGSLEDMTRLRQEVEDYWKAALGTTMQVETPDELLNNVIRSSQVRCLIAARNEAEGARVAAWIAADRYGPLESEAHSVIRGMDFMGHRDFARRSLEYFIHRYNTNGFLTTGYTTFGTAWHLWTLSEHYQLTRDTDWLQQIAPELARVGHWIVRQTEKTKKLDARGRPLPEYGLMPPGVLADWNSFAFHFTMNAYYHAGLRELGAALNDIGHPDAGVFTRSAAELRTNTLRAYEWTQSRSPARPLRDGTWIPYYPSQVHSPGKLNDFFPGQDAGRSWCYDVELGAHQLVATGMFEPRSREVARIMDHMEEVQFLADGWFDYPASSNLADWFNLGGFSKVQPYYTRNCEIYALRDDIKPFIRSYFNSLASLLNPEVLTLWEHFSASGAWDKTHETGYFLHQTRTMLVTERGEELWLAPLITSNWLKDGMKLRVANAPTRFGPVSFEVNSHVNDRYMTATIHPPRRDAPKRIILRLRHPDGKRLRSVTVDGRRYTDFDPKLETIALRPAQGTLNVQARF